MKQAERRADPLSCSREKATREQLEFACQSMATDEHDDHAIAAMLGLDVNTVRQAISPSHARSG